MKRLLTTSAVAACAWAAAMVGAPGAAAQTVGFTSPSGNIGCIIDTNYVRCDIRERNWSPPARPADCEFDYGQGVTLNRGQPPVFVCAGDTALNAGPPLAYGDKVTAGSLECTSRPSGMTCWDFQYGHEFTLSRERYELS